MTKRLRIFDFDGTVTLAEEEGIPFTAGYLKDLARLTGRPLTEIEAMAAEFAAEVAANPDKYVWEHGGYAVAPAMVDPYLRMMAVAKEIFKACRLALDPKFLDLLLGLLFGYNYPKSATCFRPGALETFLALEGSPIHVVTNSDTDAVRKKIKKLGAQEGGLPNRLSWLLPHVHGNALKYVIDPDFTGVPESMRLPGLNRPVLLRRKNYFSVLDRLRQEHGMQWQDITVIGDIFELDLAVPFALGAQVWLMTGQYTPSYERAFLPCHPQARLVASLEELLTLIRG